MSTCNEILAIVEFLGKDMTEKQAEALFIKIKSELSIANQEFIFDAYEIAFTPIYTMLSMYDGEMGGLSRY